MVFYKRSFKKKKKAISKASYLILLKAYSTWGNCSKEELRVSFKAQAASFTFSWKPRLVNPLKLTNCGRSLFFILATAGERQRWRWSRQKRNSGRGLPRCPQLLKAVRSQAGQASSRARALPAMPSRFRQHLLRPFARGALRARSYHFAATPSRDLTSQSSFLWLLASSQSRRAVSGGGT